MSVIDYRGEFKKVTSEEMLLRKVDELSDTVRRNNRLLEKLIELSAVDARKLDIRELDKAV